MTNFNEAEISRSIIASYSKRLGEQIISDVLIVGAGPSGLVAAADLAGKGLNVTILEKRLAPGGGIWGGGMGMNRIVVQAEALSILDEYSVKYVKTTESLYLLDAVELSAALILRAVQSGAVLFNLMTAEDICVRDGKVTGIVANRTMISGVLPVDPIVFSSENVIDSTGHEMCIVEMIRKRGLLKSDGTGEGPMDAETGERFVVDNVSEIYPGLWLTGMSVCAALGGPRMGPIFGGMLLSGRQVAAKIAG